MTIGEKITQRRLATSLRRFWQSGWASPRRTSAAGRAARSFLMRKSFSNCAASSASPPMNCWGRMPRLMMRPTSCLFHCGGRWSLRVISPPLAFAGTAAALTGLTGAVYHALTADQWYTDFGRFGTALRSTWCGAVLSAGLLLLAIALALLVFEVLLSKRD